MNWKAAAVALVILGGVTPTLAAELNIRHHRHARHHHYVDDALVIDFNHNYGPADFYPGTLAPPDRVVVPVNERAYGIYDGFGPYCAQSTANYRGQDGRRHPCN